MKAKKHYYDAADVKKLKEFEKKSADRSGKVLVVLAAAAVVVLAGLIWLLFPKETVVIEKRVYIQVTPVVETAVSSSPYIVEIEGRGDDLVEFTLNEPVGVSEFVAWNGSDWNEFRMTIKNANLEIVRTAAWCSRGCTDRRIVESFRSGTYYLDVQAYGKWWFRIERPTVGN
ncbi:MAG: hypothetical protein OCU12_07750 [Methanophagales archaeon]|nr:hypothetical protein [Methanophagales archaeon]